MNPKIVEIQKQLETIKQQIKTCSTNAIRFYDDPAEVAIQYQNIDELLLDEAALIEQLAALQKEENDQRAV